ncbi:MAG: resolvase [Cenarchaeum sp. SB0665_bin_23]|nr:resolvase [Cenarchaeum sp. SB0665_bin_23]MXZ94279.1 resolvase [Cenarchaeum sp. SB0666_bin_15]MYB47194.1 resolvase [Cenarchaeum sp. SB0662_bin_33]MYD58099.1 resolvase [Cenarchaeum sp. SB0678_bin_8]MYG33668.1 resolvase [Cenarchaeum sp. SB0677_bin_16]
MMSDEQKAKSSRLRRQRGYNWEDLLVKRFNCVDGWSAFRLGSPSIGLPDVLAVNNDQSSIFVIEAKSGSKTSLSVPPNQIIRCQEWCNTLRAYQKRQVVLAFKFLSKKRIGTDRYRSRTLHEYYKIWDPAIEPSVCVCSYDGDVYTLADKVRTIIPLKDCQMPFQSQLNF